MRRLIQFLLVLSVLTLSMIGPVAADNVPAGYDFFETVTSDTRFIFVDPCTTIPSSFFDPGSDPFGGASPGQTVQFQGVPLGSFLGNPTGTADTVVQRQAPAMLPAISSTDTIPIELVALSLTSASPITVTYFGGIPNPELWDITVSESPSAASTGTMTITHDSPSGGTFTSQFVVYPLFTFTRQSDGAVRTLDVGTIPLPPDCINGITLSAPAPSELPPPWLHSHPPGLLVVPGLNDGFCASCTTATADGKELTREEAALARHGVFPANRQQKPVGGYAFSADLLSLLGPYIIATIAVIAIVAGIVYTRRVGLGRLLVHH